MKTEDHPETFVYDSRINAKRILAALKEPITLEKAIRNCQIALENMGELTKKCYPLKMTQVGLPTAFPHHVA